MTRMTTKRYFWISTAIAGSAMFTPLTAQSDDFEHSDLSNTTNAGFVIDGDDSLTVTDTGAITTVGNAVDAIRTTGSNNRIINNGTLATADVGADGIVTGSQNFVENTGRIETLEGVAAGIEAGNGNEIVNSGNIRTQGSNANGIVASNDNQIQNSGIISTIETNSSAIVIADGNVIKNSGQLETSGSFSRGILGQNSNDVTNSGAVSINAEQTSGLAFANNNSLVNSGTITTRDNDSNGIDAVTNNQIENSGMVSTASVNSRGINVFDGNVITNSGTIETSGSFGTGVFGENGNDVTNSGLISTQGKSSTGIRVQSNNTIENSGAITTSDNLSNGISGFANNVIVNSGTIVTKGTDGEGILAVDNSLVVNTGLIRTSGPDAEGIAIVGKNAVANHGRIETTGTLSHGIFGTDDETISNTGEILVAGLDADGMQVNDLNTVTNSGLVVSATGLSFAFGTNNTLNLAAPSFIGGRIDLGINNTVNVTTGASHSVLWDFSTGLIQGGNPTFAGTVPVFYNNATQQVATFDPSAFSASVNALADISDNVSGLIRHGFAQSEPQVAQGFASNRPDARGWWLSGFGSFNEYDGDATTLDQDFTYSGIAIGYQTDLAQDWVVGGLLGYGTGTVEVDARYTGSFDNDMEGVFGAIYGRKRFDQTFVDLSLSAGWLSHSDRRFVNDNLAFLGLAEAQASYDSWWIAPELRLGHDLSLPENWVITPSAQLRYTYQSIDGYTETGNANAMASVASREVGVMETQLELAATKLFEKGSATLRGGWQHREASVDSAARVTLVGQTQSLPYSANTGSDFFVGADARFALAEWVSLDVSAQANFGETDGYRGTAQITWDF